MRVWILSLMFLVLAGCASTVTTDYDSERSFSQYDTWAFAPEDIRTNAMSLDASRLESAIEDALAGKNLSKVAADEAGLWVSYGVKEVERLETSGFTYGLGLNRGLFGFGVATMPDVREIKEGRVVVELIDPEADRVVWRAFSKRNLNEDMAPDQRRKLINEEVAKMFDKYPPGG
jgi:hypothetical protein